MSLEAEPDLLALETQMARYLENADLCPRCGNAATWEDCTHCWGDGFIDNYELDPSWYEPGDTEQCDWCQGKGGWWICLSKCGDNGT